MRTLDCQEVKTYYSNNFMTEDFHFLVLTVEMKFLILWNY